jgi:hypothetical protein
MTAWGRSAAEREAAVLVELLTTNSGNGATLDDGQPLFGTGSTRGNKASTAGTISIDWMALHRSL